MSFIDWIVLSGTLLFIVVYGVTKSRSSRNLEGYLLADRSQGWMAITLSIMATQASAITFLSTPGQAYRDGMGFVQFYFGLPIAMVILSVTAVPIFHRLKVYTAYEFLEGRFDSKTRTLTAMLFLVQRGLAAGLTILAPALILSVILGWDLTVTNLLVGILVIIYTTVGGTKAVAKTHVQQMLVIMVGMLAAFAVILYRMPTDLGFLDAVRVAGKLGRLDAVDFTFDLSNRYNIWSGLLGGTFLALSYFGTDQSQVQRYLTGRSLTESRMALLANGFVKIPMQFFILFLGAMVFVFYQFTTPPIFFDPVARTQVIEGARGAELAELETNYHLAMDDKQVEIREVLAEIREGDEVAIAAAEQRMHAAADRAEAVRNEAIDLIVEERPEADPNDANFVFLTFVVTYLPKGLIGLVLAAIISASMSSTASELNALASTTVVDLYKRYLRPDDDDRRDVMVSRVLTVFWGALAIVFAQSAARLGTLVEAVNILGSLFYGTILGIFLLAFYSRRISGTAVFVGALAAEALVVICWLANAFAFLWLNVVGCLAVFFFASIFSFIWRRPAAA